MKSYISMSYNNQKSSRAYFFQKKKKRAIDIKNSMQLQNLNGIRN